MDVKKIERLQKQWKNVARAEVPQFGNLYTSAEEMKDALAGLGFDTNLDETYEILADGLTKKDFDQRFFYIKAMKLIDIYHSTQNLYQHRYADGYVNAHYFGLERLMKYEIPEFEGQVKELGMPQNMSKVHVRQLSLIRELYQDGTLAQEMIEAARALVISRFRSVFSCHKSGPEDAQSGLREANSALEIVDIVGEEHFEDQDILIKPTGFTSQMWEDDIETFSVEKLKALRSDLVISALKNDFKDIKRNYDERPDTGYSIHTMPLQEILTILEEEGYDVRDPQTFEKLDTDIDTFWTYYKKERAEGLKVTNIKNLIKPEFKR